jgi:glycosyltransferase involved in cell wall biosynthesis
LQHGEAEVLAHTAFVLGEFPKFSETFIHRELEAMREAGLEFHVLSTAPRRPASDPLPRALIEVQRDAIYFDYRSARAIASMTASLASTSVRETMRWMLRFPHRTAAHRARAAAAVLVAAHVAPELERRGIRYVHSHFATFPTEVAMSVSHLLGIPYGCTWHAYGIYRDRNILEQKLAGARTVFTCTKRNLEHLQALCPEARSRIHLAYHGLNLDEVPQPTPISNIGPPIILAVGRLVAKKGFSHLIDAASALEKSGRRFELRLIGDGPERRALKAQVARLGLAREVRFLGTQPNSAVFAQLAEARVVAVPSVVTEDGDMDGLPNVVLEALSLGRPVVGSDVSGIPELIVHGETGFLVEPENPLELCEKLSLVLDDAALAAELGSRGRLRIFQDFDVKKNVQRMVETLVSDANGSR